MRALLFVFLIACEHRPAPKQEPVVVAASDAGAAAGSAGSAGSAAAVPAGSAAPTPQPVGDDVCLAVGVKIADMIISAATDAQQKALYEQEKTKLVKRFSENCKRENWPEATRTCFLRAKDSAEIEKCTREMPKPPPPPPAPAGSAAGSAAPAKGTDSAAAPAKGSAAAPAKGSAAKRE